MMIAVDESRTFLLSGTGDIIEPDEGVIGIGSGGAIVQAAAMALVRHSLLEPREIVEKSMAIAASLCIYTNTDITVEEL
jgi:ATP-dependent HslUV protease subunit HslV